jgi:glycosyltransferase involved in cell wall biosynthesis
MRTDNSARDLVTVVIPCYNSGATVTQTVDSVHIQTWPNIEIVVIDDGSTDPQTIGALEALQCVRLIRQGNAGLPAARNAGFAAANGTYVLPLDADDWLEPDAIEQLVAGLRGDSTASFAYSYLQLEGEARGVLAKSYNFFEQLFLNQMPYCLLLPRSTWESVGCYDESMRKGYEDWEFNIRLGAAGCYGYVVQRPLFRYRVSSGGMLLSQSNRLHGALWAEIQDKHKDIYNLPRLIGLWREWRDRPSTYPLLLYFAWFAMHRLLPPAAFSALFRWLRQRSHSRRVTAKHGGV